MEHKDIFISYKNDGIGNQFAYRLVADLEKVGYSVYFNPHEQRSHDFSEKLRHAVENCRDFVLILSPGCLEQLKRNEDVDWVREEILMAHDAGKPIIPILIEGTTLPKHAEEMPEKLQFLPFVDAITFPEGYIDSPFSKLLGVLHAKTGSSQPYANTFNSNPDFDVNEDFVFVLNNARANAAGDPAQLAEILHMMYDLGMMYYYGVTDENGTSARKPAKAYQCMKKIVDCCSEFAQMVKDIDLYAQYVSQLRELKCHALNIISRLYYSGEVPGEPQSYELAFLYTHEAAVFDDYAAMNEGYMLRVGLGCTFDYEKIIEYHTNSMQRKDDQVVLSLAEFYTNHGKFHEAMELYVSLTHVSPEADYRIGLMYLDGLLSDPPRPDPITASYHLRNAADNNHAMAAFEFGRLCFRPTGRFRKDFKNAQTYLTIAADHGIADAQYILGFMYEKGHVEKSLKKAIHYYSLAMRQGHSLAASELAKCYQEPEFQNYQLAYECAKLAASHGIAEATLTLANLLFWGRGCKPDVPRAIGLYQRALEHGVHYASIMLEKARKSLQ